MVSCIKELTDTTARGVSGISDGLFAKMIMSEEIHRKMMSNLEDHKKASILIKDVSGQIKLNPEKFLVFVDVLKKDGPWTNDIVSFVLKKYDSIKASGEVNLYNICVFVHISPQLSLFLHHPMQLHLNHKGPY